MKAKQCKLMTLVLTFITLFSLSFSAMAADPGVPTVPTKAEAKAQAKAQAKAEKKAAAEAKKAKLKADKEAKKKAKQAEANAKAQASEPKYGSYSGRPVFIVLDDPALGKAPAADPNAPVNPYSKWKAFKYALKSGAYHIFSPSAGIYLLSTKASMEMFQPKNPKDYHFYNEGIGKKMGHATMVAVPYFVRVPMVVASMPVAFVWGNMRAFHKMHKAKKRGIYDMNDEAYKLHVPFIYNPAYISPNDDFANPPAPQAKVSVISVEDFWGPQRLSDAEENEMMLKFMQAKQSESAFDEKDIDLDPTPGLEPIVGDVVRAAFAR